jgi:hypothetical protein
VRSAQQIERKEVLCRAQGQQLVELMIELRLPNPCRLHPTSLWSTARHEAMRLSCHPRRLAADCGGRVFADAIRNRCRNLFGSAASQPGMLKYQVPGCFPFTANPAL